MAEDEKTRLFKNIAQESEFFGSIIDTIPPEHYGYDEETKEILRERKHALVDQKLTADKRAKLSNKTKGRLAQLDERQCHTNSQIFAFLLENSRKEKKGKKRPAGNDGEDTPGRPKGKMQKTAKNEKMAKKKSKPINAAASGTNGGPISSDRQDLLAKLQSKLDEMRAKRGLQPGAAGGIDYEEKKRMKRRLSKAKLKEKRRQEKDHKGGGTPNADFKPGEKPAKTPQVSNTPKKLTNGLAGDSKPQTLVNVNGQAKKRKTETSPSRPPSKKPAVIDKDGRMVFSKFDFALPGVVEEPTKDKWAKKNSGKDYKRLLDKQERLEGKLEQLEEAGKTGQAKRLKEKTQWDAAAQRAKGAKVKDDPALLKKNLKRKEKRKEHSQRKWEGRNEATQRKQQEKQQKRKDNIQGRKKDKKDRKVTKARKKGRLV